jgi:hypothetical protein
MEEKEDWIVEGGREREEWWLRTLGYDIGKEKSEEQLPHRQGRAQVRQAGRHLARVRRGSECTHHTTPHHTYYIHSMLYTT